MTRLSLFATVISALLLAGCGSSASETGKMTSFSSSNGSGSQAELLSVAADQMAHIAIHTVAKTALARTLRLTGTVAYDGFRTTPVITQVGGPVSRILVVPGQHVRAGEPLLFVSSPDFSQLRAAYVKARDAVSLADRVYKRAQDLFAHGAIAQADVEQAESTRTQAEADLQAAEQSIKILGIASPDDLINNAPSAELSLQAPRAGEIVERLCAQGQLLQAGTTQCFTLSDMTNVWILVNVYQNDIGFVKVGDEVTIVNETYADTLRGKIEYVSPALDPTTRTLQARISSPNPGERMKKDMYVTADVRAGVIPDALVVPNAAVLRDAQNMPYVYIQSGDRQFARRMVTLGESDNGQTQIVTGLQAGDKIVGDGALFLQFQDSLQR
jgi:cobalt-zinc-cadmium efflux system membrane fusion protein